MTYDPNVFGYVDGQPTYSRDEFIYKKRRRGPITDDAELVYNDMPEVWADLQRRQEMTERPFKGPGKSVPELAIRFELEKKWIAEGKSVKSREFYKALAEALREEAPAWQH